MDAVKTVAPMVRAEQVKRLVKVLRENGDWMTRRELANELGISSASWERTLRAIASKARGIIISWPGSPGYKHVLHASLEEMDHGISAFYSSGREDFANAGLLMEARRRKAAAMFPDAVPAATQDLLPLAT